MSIKRDVSGFSVLQVAAFVIVLMLFVSVWEFL